MLQAHVILHLVASFSMRYSFHTKLRTEHISRSYFLNEFFLSYQVKNGTFSLSSSFRRESTWHSKVPNHHQMLIPGDKQFRINLEHYKWSNYQKQAKEIGKLDQKLERTRYTILSKLSFPTNKTCCQQSRQSKSRHTGYSWTMMHQAYEQKMYTLYERPETS
jgi:hypothetical protein